MLSEDSTSSSDWKIFNLFLDKHSINTLDEFKIASKKYSKLISDYDKFIEELDNNDNYSSNSVINITLKEIENISNTLKSSHIFSFLFSEYINAKNLCLKTFKNKKNSLFFNYLPLLESIKVDRYRYDRINEKVQKMS
jgi:hypothetical protein